MSKISYIINGTCDGYNNLNFLRHSKNLDKKTIDLIDNNDGSNSKTKGSICYSLSIQDNNYIVSIIQIVRDGLRSQSIGFLRFNLIVPNGYAIPNNIEIVDLLKNGLELYSEIFVDKTNMVLIDEKKDDSIEVKIEELISKIKLEKVNEYNWKIGKKKPAYIYDDKIEEYLKYQNIFQKEYLEFHEIYIIKRTENPENNILDVLKHELDGDITANVNIKNPSYTINIINQDNDLLIQGIKNGEEIKLNDPIDIHFKKEYHKTENIKGTWIELLSKYSLIVKKTNPHNHTIEIDCPRLEPNKKEIELYIQKTKNNNRIKAEDLGVKIINEENSQLKFENDKIILFGKEIDQLFEIKITNERYKTIENKYYNSKDKSITIKIDDKEQIVKKENKKGLNFRLILVIILFISILTLTYSIIKNGPFNDGKNTKTEKEEKKLESDGNIDLKINEYLDGEELFNKTLKEYLAKVKEDSLNEKIQYLKIFRESIDQNNLDKIKYTYKTIKRDKKNNELYESKKILLKYIIENHEVFKRIERRESIPLGNLKDTLDRHISINEEILLNEKQKKDSIKKVPKNNAVGKYTESEFFEKFNNKIDPEPEKLNTKMNDIINKFKTLSPENQSSIKSLKIKDLYSLKQEIEKRK